MGWIPLCCAPVTTRAHAVLIFHKQQHNRWSLDLQMLIAVCLLDLSIFKLEHEGCCQVKKML